MVSGSEKLEFQTLRTIIHTTAICLGVSAVTFLIWSGPFYLHVLVSLGFGYGSVATEYILHRFARSLGRVKINIISMISGVSIGIINAALINNAIFEEVMGPSILPTLGLGIMFTAGAFLYFYAHEQKLIMTAKIERERREKSEKEKALVLSQLNRLQSQIEPHFLFNTLANLNVLIEHDPKRAQQMLAKLTQLLRSSLNISRQQVATIEQELSLIDAFLSIQKIRLGDRLEFQLDYDQDIAQHLIPPMLLQPLVENAVKHGIEPKGEQGQIKVTAEINNDQLHLSVVDNGVGLSAETEHSGISTKGNGIALSNIRERLAKLTDNDGGLKIVELVSGGVKAQITLPLSSLEAIKTNMENQEVSHV